MCELFFLPSPMRVGKEAQRDADISDWVAIQERNPALSNLESFMFGNMHS
jgi:hypothetical protein